MPRIKAFQNVLVLAGDNLMSNGSVGPCATIQYNYFIEWIISSFSFQKFWFMSLTNEKSHAHRNVDITVSCAAVDDRCVP